MTASMTVSIEAVIASGLPRDSNRSQSPVALPVPELEGLLARLAMRDNHTLAPRRQPKPKRASIIRQAGVFQLCSKAMQRVFDPYRPELHYMRGPGPKWHEKHARKRSSSEVQS